LLTGEILWGEEESSDKFCFATFSVLHEGLKKLLSGKKEENSSKAVKQRELQIFGE
jgi:hypothetical protein